MLPMTWNGGMSAKFRLRNPMAVVSDVRNTGQVLVSSEWTAACFRSIPWRSPTRTPSMMCTEWATVTAIRANRAAALSPKSRRPA